MFHYIFINCDIPKMGTYFLPLCYASNYSATATLQWKTPNACNSLEHCYKMPRICVPRYSIFSDTAKTLSRMQPGFGLITKNKQQHMVSPSIHCYPHQVEMGEGSQWRESHLLPEHRSQGGMRFHLLCFNNSVRTPEIHINCIHGKIYRPLKEIMWWWGFCFVALTNTAL